jgi:hypothetical protein
MLNFLQPQIAIIDDKINDVIGIINELNNRGVGCKFYNADLTNGDSFPQIPIDNIKLVFLDLYFEESKMGEDKFDAELVAPWIKAIIPDNTFYVLIIWSKDTHQVEATLEELKSINRSPLYYLSKSKVEYKTEDSYDFLQLLIDIDEELKNKPELMELILWRDGILRASNNVVAGLSSDTIDLNRKIKKIILAQGGISIKEKSAATKKEAFYDALDSVLYTNSKNTRLLEINEQAAEGIYNEHNFNDPTLKRPLQDSKLNSWFIFQRNPIRLDSIESGAVYKTNQVFLRKTYSITTENTFSDLFFKGINNAEYIDIAILLTPSCNIAQDKVGNNFKLLSGIYFANPIRKDDGSLKHVRNNGDCYKIIDNVDLNDKIQGVMIFDYRYIFTIPKSFLLTRDRFTKLAVFSKDLLSEFQVGYSSYSSRIGYIEIL